MGALFDLMKMKPTSSVMDFSGTVDKPSYAAAPSLPKGVTPVWDEMTGGLKVIPTDRAQAFIDAGYKVGADAQREALNNSNLGKLGAAATTVSNTASAGGFNALLAAVGRKDMLKSEQEVQDANPKTTIAAGLATEVGLAGLGAYNPAIGEGAVGTTRLVGDALLGDGSRAATAAGWLTRAASGATMGATQAQVRGMADEFTREKVIDEPASIEKMIASGLSEVGTNAMWGAGTALGLGAIAAVRPATGNLLAKLEQVGVLKKRMVKDAEATAARGFEASRVTLSEEEKTLRATQTKSSEAASATADVRTQFADSERVQRKVRNLANDSREVKTRTKEYGKETTTSPIYDEAKAGATAEAQAKSGLEEPVHPADTDFHFEYPEHYTTEQKQSFVRQVTKERLADNPAAMELWNENAMLEAKMKDISNSPNASARNEEFLKLQRKKEAIKKTLAENVPADIGPDGVARPSFEQLNLEMARASGNPFVDLKGSKAAGKPQMPKANTKAPKPVGKQVRTFGEDVDESLHTKTRTLGDETSAADATTKSGEQTHSQQKASLKIDEAEQNRVDNKKKWSVTFVAPKRAPEMKQAGYERPFDPQTVFNAGIGIGVFNKAAGAAVAGAMGTANAFAHVAGHHEAIGRAYDKVIVPLARKGTIGLRALQREERARGRQSTSTVPVKLGEYARLTNFVNAASTNPDRINDYLTKTYPNIAIYHPEVLAGAAGVTARAVAHMQQQVAKKPFEPSLQPQDFKPPRAQQVRLLRTWAALCNPEEALRSGDPQAIAAVKEVYPHLHREESDVLTHEIATSKKPIRGRAARNLSRYLGSNVRPIDDPAALKRLQETGGMPPPPEGGAPKPSGGSAQASKGAVMRDSPDADIASVLG